MYMQCAFQLYLHGPSAVECARRENERCGVRDDAEQRAEQRREREPGERRARAGERRARASGGRRRAGGGGGQCPHWIVSRVVRR